MKKVIVKFAGEPEQFPSITAAKAYIDRIEWGNPAPKIYTIYVEGNPREYKPTGRRPK